MSFDSIAFRSNAQDEANDHPLKSLRDGIPSPRGLPLLGNILDMQNEVPVHGLGHLADIYGPIFKLKLPGGRERIVISSAQLLEEVSDEKRFYKKAGDGLASLKRRPDGHNGLFSAPTEADMDWQLAHRILMPAFGPLSIQGMFDEMHDIASQLVFKFARMGSDYRIPVTSDFTRLTLDTIALCAMDFRFNSFYQEGMHPFVEAMNGTLQASSDRLKVASLIRRLLPWDNSAEKVKQDARYMRQIAQELVEHRRANPTDKRDLLNAMVNGKDPKTGQPMPDGLITTNMVTFLIAGHETTSGLLSFAFLNLLQNPEALFKAQAEVDQKVGKSKLTAKHINDLPHLNAVLRETLRLSPTAPAFTRGVRPECADEYVVLANGKYAVSRDDQVICMLTKCQRDPALYGEDANDFRPERMLDGEFEKLPAGAWKPFGTGMRSCIGRAFAWQEALIVMVLLLQNFNFRLDDPDYQLRIKQTLTIKPSGFFMRASLREGIDVMTLQRTLASSGDMEVATARSAEPVEAAHDQNAKQMTILYGSNTGTCQSLAHKLSVDAKRNGFNAKVLDMDSGVQKLSKNQPIIIITASYEGLPPDNASQFVAWLEALEDNSALEGVQYAVFGCGHSDWVGTFQRIPTVVDEVMKKHGADRITERGSSDASKGDIFSDFDTYLEKHLLPSLGGSQIASSGPAFDVEIRTQNRSSYLRQDVLSGTVIRSHRLTTASEPEKWHLAIKLPDGMTYTTGDYLAILPMNSQRNVSRVISHFNLARDSTVSIKQGAATFLPTGTTLSIQDLMRGYVELCLPVTKKDIQACISLCKDDPERTALEAHLASEENFRELLKKRVSLLDVLEANTGIDMPFSCFLSMLPPLRARHYSISSSPLQDPTSCTITYGIINEAAYSGNGRYLGVTSNFLAELKAGDEVQVSVRATNKYFHLPADVSKTPVLMFGAGTGLAPFRGFCEERAIQIEAGGKALAPAMLFVGCRYSDRDRLYAEDIDKWAKLGAVDVKYAFSKEPEKSDGCSYIQDRMLLEKEGIKRMWDGGAKVFICGGPGVSEEIGHAARELVKEGFKEKGLEYTDEKATEWFRARRNDRFVVDVFA